MKLLCTAGHVDHGKSTLVKALTGIEPDRLMEEQVRGITIVNSFLSYDFLGEKVSIIDVPGHEKLVKTMLGALNGIDAFLLCIDGREGVKPQTIEHLELLYVTGIRQGIVIITKAALSVENEKKLRELLARLGYATIPWLSFHSDEPRDLLPVKHAINALLTSNKRDTKQITMRIDRLFALPHTGSIVTGTILGGMIRAGDNVYHPKSQRFIRVSQLEVHSVQKDEAYAGERVALKLKNIPRELEKGDLLVAAPTQIFETSTLLLTPECSLEDPLIAHNKAVKIHLGPIDKTGKLKKNPLRVELETADFYVDQERAVVRLASPARTLFACHLNRPKTQSTKDRILMLLEAHHEDQPLSLGMHRGELAKQFEKEKEVRDAIQQLIGEGKIVETDRRFRLPTHAVTYSDEEQRVIRDILAFIEAYSQPSYRSMRSS